MSRLISFSVFGSKPLYLRGAVHNARLAPRIYPGWTCRFYVQRGLDIITELRDLGAEVVEMEPELAYSGTFWRFLAADDPEAECVIFRDADSRLNVREKAAVDEWLASDAMGHRMFDRPAHCGWHLLAGMCGLKRGAVSSVATMMRGWGPRAKKGEDQHFLEQRVFHAVSSWMTHDGSVSWPAHEPCARFVGEPVDPEVEE